MPPKSEYLTVLDLVPFGQASGDNQFFALRLSRPAWQIWNPGQFVMLRPISFGLEIPLARPFCICHMTQSHLVCFFKATGKGTHKMANMRVGDKLVAWGPLGNSFAVERGKPTLLLAGGMGIAPFVGYAYRHPEPWNVTMLFGHREPVGCFPVESINERCTVDSLREQAPGDLDNFIYTLEERIRDCAKAGGLVLACGPDAFLRTSRNLAIKHKVRMQISLERRMACGVGACLGCVATRANQTASSEKMSNPIQTCTHGPIFWADEIEI